MVSRRLILLQSWRSISSGHGRVIMVVVMLGRNRRIMIVMRLLLFGRMVCRGPLVIRLFRRVNIAMLIIRLLILMVDLRLMVVVVSRVVFMVMHMTRRM